MHEGPMVDGLVATALRAAGPARRVQAVHVVVGAGAGVDPAALRTHFALHVAGTSLQDADLVIRSEGAAALCWDCATRFPVDGSPERTCPACGSHRTRRAPIAQPYVEAIDIDDEGAT